MTIFNDRIELVKSAHDIMDEAYDQIRELKPTPDEISKFADKYDRVYSVVTYSRSKGGSDYFLRYMKKRISLGGGFT